MEHFCSDSSRCTVYAQIGQYCEVNMPEREMLLSLSKETLIDILEDQSKNWLAHDRLWFQAVEKQYGMETAIGLDKEAWIAFTQIEAKRIMRRHNIPPGGGIPALKKRSSSDFMLISMNNH
jgi:hypothetical protein